jgi:hypothetical protein
MPDSRVDDFLWFPDAADKAAPNCNAHMQGYNAFKAGRMLNENPHALHTPEATLWTQGWMECSGEDGEDAQ